MLHVVLALGLLSGGHDPSTVRRAIVYPRASSLFKPSGFDSWWPMVAAWDSHQRNPSGDLYEVFFRDGIKFQYPPSSLLVMPLIPRELQQHMLAHRSSFTGTAPLNGLSISSTLAGLLMVMLSAAIFARATLGPPSAETRTARAATYALTLLLGITFFPLWFGHALGQIQVFLGCLIAIGVWSYVCLPHKWGRIVAGVCFGLCCLVKPHYVLLLLWSFFRGERVFATAMMVVGVLGLALSLWVFGLDAHLRYLDVLQLLSRQGEVFFTNHSINGLLHRVLGNGSAVDFEERSFPPYHPVVYYGTLASSLAMLGFALWKPGVRVETARQKVLDLALIVMAVTMASPIAWDHHYGVFFPMFALIGPEIMRARPAGRFTPWLLLLGYAFVAHAVREPSILHANRLVGVLGTNHLWGGMVLFVLTWRTRSQPEQGALASDLPPRSLAA